MKDTRADPYALLKAIRRDEDSSEHRRGQLKIFFRLRRRRGKTYAMLRPPTVQKKRGIDVAVGYVEPHARPQTAALLEGLELLPTRKAEHNGITLQEFDLDGAIARSPQLILVDELAHTNAGGCRHSKALPGCGGAFKGGNQRVHHRQRAAH